MNLKDMTRLINGEALAEYLQQHLPDYARPYFDRALAGDARDFERLVGSAPNHLRVVTAMWTYLCRPVQEHRATLHMAWGHDHQHVIAEAGSTARLRTMFRRADFSIPDFIPDPVQVWRGVSGTGYRKWASRGHSWTLNRDVACFFATRHGRPEPLVISATIPRSDILFYSNERHEEEVVLGRFPTEVSVDPSPTDWQSAGMTWKEEPH